MAFTPYYWVSVLLLLGYFSLQGGYLASWVNSFTARFVVNFLLFGGVLTLCAMGCWLCKVAVLPILPIALYAVFAITIRLLGDPDNKKKQFISWEDALAIGLSSVGILVFIMSFYVGHSQTAASVQAISSGFDNNAHLNLVEADHFQRGYVIGSYANTKQQILLPPLAAYPQGWHLITAFVFTDMGYRGTTPAQFINAYVIAMLVWQFISIYLFTRASLYFAGKFMERTVSRKAMYIGLAAANVLFQIAIFWGIFYLGFALFTAVVAYMLLLTGFLADDEEVPASLFTVLAVSLLAAAAVSLSWQLEGPVAFAMIALRYLRKGSFSRLIALLREKLRGTLIVLFALVSGGAFIFAAFTEHKYSGTGTGALSNANGGIYGVSDTLVIIVYVVTVAFLIGFVKRSKGRYDYLIPALILPSFLLAFAIYFFQSFTTETVNYYFVKTLSSGLLIMAVFFTSICAYGAALLHRITANYLYIGIVAIVSMMGMIALNGQSLDTLHSLVASKAIIPTATAQALADNLPSTTGSANNFVVVFRQALPQEDVMGSYLAYNANHNYNDCINQVRVWLGYNKYRAISQINQCAKTVHITVITSKNTRQYIENLKSPNIKIVNVS